MPRSRPEAPTPGRTGADLDALIGPAPQGGWRVVVGAGLPTVNALLRMHWARRNRLKKAFTLAVGLECLAARVPRAAGRRRVQTWAVFDNAGRKPDGDNINKCVLDGLRDCGALVDDSDEWCDAPTPRVVRGRKRLTVIDIEDCP